jgi:L-lactate dehydrogenase (cytochrome)
VSALRQLRETLRSVLQLKPIELHPTRRRLARSASVADMRLIAKRRLPRGVFDYIDGGAEDERTLRANSDAFAKVTFRPRVLRGVTDIDVSGRVLGESTAFPFIMAPTGFTRIADPQGELAVARAAERAGLPYTLSTLGTRSIEEVRTAAPDARLWFQVYAWRDRALVADMVRRAALCNYEALMLTVDTAVFGRRERDLRRGFSLPPKIGPGTFIDGALHPEWTLSFLRSEPIRFANVVGADVGDGSSPVDLAAYINSQFDPGLSWSDVEWLRSLWAGPIIVKGIQTVDDAVIAAEMGVEAIALSNHGGRQLDDAPAIFDLIAPVADAVGDRIEIISDGGIRRGSDIVKAMAAGATACMGGRAYLYALGAAGEAGVDQLLATWSEDIRRTLALLGVSSMSELDRDVLGSPRTNS